MEVNWATIQNHTISRKQKPRKILVNTLEEKVTILENLDDALEKDRRSYEKNKYKKLKIDYRI